MAGVDNTTPKRRMLIQLRQRTSDTDLNTVNELSQQMDAIGNYEAICALSRMIRGMELSHNSGRIFDVGVGSALWKGELVRLVSAGTVTLDENADPNPRIDLIEITGVTATNSDLGLIVTLGALTRTSVSAEAVGTGDASTKPWDLANSGVDPSTLKVQLAGTASGGWNFSPGTGTLGVDQIIFHDAPGSGVAITADYDYLTGGAEGNALLNTRTTLTPTLNVVKGTPAASPSAPSATSGSVIVGTIEVPGSWTGGSSGTSFAYDSRKYMVHQDKVQRAKATYSATAQDSGKLINPIRNMHGLMSGFRLQYATATSFKITPGWGVSLGQSFYSIEDIEETGLSLGSAGWRYVFLAPPTEAGEPPTIANISSNPPTSENMIQGLTANDLYVGALYWDGAAVRKFYTRGNHVFFDSEVSHSLTVTATGTDLDVTSACPVTGRTLLCRLQVSLASSASDGTLQATVQSQRNTNVGDPTLRAAVLQPSTSLTVLSENNGWLIAEENSSVRYVNYTTTTAGTVATPTATLLVQGYIDDYRTLDTSGAAVFY